MCWDAPARALGAWPQAHRHTIFPLQCNGAVAADWRPDYSSLPTQPDGRSQACADRFPALLEMLSLHPDICLRKKDRLPGAAWLSSSSCLRARTLASPRRAPRDSTSRLRGSALHYSGSGPTGTWNSRCRDARNQVRGGGCPASHGSTSPPPRSGFHLPVQWRDRSSISTCPGSWRRGYDAEFPRRDGGATRPLRIAPGSDIRCPSRPSSGPGVPGPSPVLSMSFDALSRISVARMSLPRASLGFDTLNIPVINSVTRSARSRSRLMRRNSNACATATETSSTAAVAATATPTRCRRTYLPARYPALAGRARTGSFRKYLPMSAASSEGVAYRLERSFSKALRVIASRSPRNCRARVGASAPRFCAVIPVCAPSVRSLVLGRAASSSRNRRGN